MPATISHGSYTIPFDEELFAMYMQNEPDLVRNAYISSGIIEEDGNIADLIRNGANVFTIPFYGHLADDPDDNYDGQHDINLGTMGATQQTGVVYGRAHGWYADDFVADFTVANPLAAMAARVAKYWQNKAQARLIGISEAILSLSSMANNVKTKLTLDANTLSDTCQEIWGDHKHVAACAVMDSAVAQEFEDKQRVDYLKYTDPNGVTRDLNVWQINGINVIIDDGLPKSGTATAAGVYTVTVDGTLAAGDKLTVCGTTITLDATSAASATAAVAAMYTALGTMEVYSLSKNNGVLTMTEKSGHYGAGAPTASIESTAGTVAVATTTAPANYQKLYTTYIFGQGAFHYAPAPVAHPVFRGRDELKRGGVEFFGNRFREAIHPNGFNYALASGVISPEDSQLADASKWSLAYSNPKAIPFAKLVTPGHTA